MKDSIRYLAFGDSLTVGYGAAPGLGFVPQYAEELGKVVNRQVLPTNAGVNGATTQNLLDMLRTEPDIRAAVTSADLMTITAGGNDLIQAALPFVYEGDAEILNSALQAYEINYRNILKSIRDIQGSKASPLVVLVGLYNPLPLMAEAETWVRKFNAFLRQLAGPTVHVVDVYDAFVGCERELLYADHIHPNAKGYAVMAEQIMRTVPLHFYEPIVNP